MRGEKKEIITGVRENRLSGLLIHIMISASIFFMVYVGYIPMVVLFGLFLFMGFTSLTGNQFFERLLLWVTDPKLYLKTHYSQNVPPKWIHRFTLIQLLCFGVLWVLKASRFGILFPLMIASLVPINMYILRFFRANTSNTLIFTKRSMKTRKNIHWIDCTRTSGASPCNWLLNQSYN